MADLYVRSTDGNNADDGSTWALAKADLHGPTWGAGDRIFVSDAHAQSAATTTTIASAGTLVSPTKIICGDDVAEPSTAVATTATVTTTSTAGINITGAVYVYGISFFSGTGASSGPAMIMSGSAGFFEDCSFQQVNTNAGNDIVIGSSSAGQLYNCIWKNCTVKFAAAGHQIRSRQAFFHWEGGSVLAGGTSPTTMFSAEADSGIFDVSGVDFSNLSTTFNFFTSTGIPGVNVIRNCKLPASWAGSLGTPTGTAERFEMYNCDSTDTNYRLWVEDYAGSIKSETTIVRTGGASDGTTSLAWKMLTTANSEYPSIILRSPEIAIWNETVGSAITVTVEVVTDNVTLTDGEAWIEAEYLGTAGFPLGTVITDAKADVLATAANQTSSSETWTTTGLTTPVKQKFSVTFTPQEKGVIHIVTCLAKASTTMYVCPKVTIS